MHSKLSAAEVARLRKRPGTHRVSKNLYLRVKPERTASWLFRFVIQSRASWMGLGSYDTFSLEEARTRARSAQQLLADGIDPLETKHAKRHAQRLEAAKAVSFRDCAEQYMAAHAPSWKNAKHREQWSATLASYAYPDIGDLKVAEIDTASVVKLLKPIWTTKTETANRVRGRIESVLDFAKAHGYRDGDNPARWKGHLDDLLAKPSKLRKVRNHPALTYADLPPFIAELRANDSISARALEFTILTAARTGEAIGATWDEIDLDTKTWTVPAERMKAGELHKVPLSDRVLAILAALPRERDNDHVFIGGKKGKPLSNMAMLELIKGMRPGLTVHGFRSTFRTWCEEQTSYPHLVCELALGHKQPDKLMQAYQRGDLFAKRAKLMAEWGRFCTAPPAQAGNVTPIRRAGAR